MEKNVKIKVLSCNPNGKTFGQENKPLFDVIIQGNQGPMTVTGFKDWSIGEHDVILVDKEYQGVIQYSIKSPKRAGNGNWKKNNDEQIARSVALKEAVVYHSNDEAKASVDLILETAEQFFTWLRKKETPPQTEAPQAAPAEQAQNAPAPPAPPAELDLNDPNKYNDDLPF